MWFFNAPRLTGPESHVHTDHPSLRPDHLRRQEGVEPGAGPKVENRLARISVRFDADIAAVTRDQDGNLVAGSLSDAVETHDIWTFARKLRSDDPNWKLVETDEA